MSRMRKCGMGLASALGFQNYAVVGYSRRAIIIARLLTPNKRITKALLGGMGEAFTNINWPCRVAFLSSLAGKEKTPAAAQLIKEIQEQGLDPQQLLFQQQAQPATLAADLAKVTIPVLVIAGEADNDNGTAEALPNYFQKQQLRERPAFIIRPGNRRNLPRPF